MMRILFLEFIVNLFCFIFLSNYQGVARASDLPEPKTRDVPVTLLGSVPISVPSTSLLQASESIRSLAKFKAAVEDEAYERTLKLCYGYRWAVAGMPENKNFPPSYAVESLNEWAKVLKEGFVQPLSSIAGLKSDFLEEKGVPLWAMESWFRSLYSLYLINSWGFLKAGIHCLQTMDQAELNNFASAIVLADYEATVLFEVASGASLGFLSRFARLPDLISKTIGALGLKSLWFRMSGYHPLLSALQQRVNQTYISVGSAVALPLVVDNLDEQVERHRRIQEAVQSFNNGDFFQETKENLRRVLLMQASVRYLDDLDALKRGEDLQSLFHWIKQHEQTQPGWLNGLIVLWKKDLEQLIRQTKEQDRGTEEAKQTEADRKLRYRNLIEQMLPVLEQLKMRPSE